MELLTSKSSPRVKALRGLLSAKKVREELGLFALEGARLCEEAVLAGRVIDQVYLTAGAWEKYPEICASLVNAALENFEISETVAHWVADTQNPQGLFALCPYFAPEPPVIAPTGQRYLFLDELQNPGNVGTILRTALALGVTHCFVGPGTAEVLSPKVLRASMGAVLRLPITICKDLCKEILALRQQGVPVFGAALDEDALPVSRELVAGSWGLVVGNEGAGITPETLGCCDGSVMIPMMEGAQSLNVASAAAILLWEMTRGKVEEKE